MSLDDIVAGDYGQVMELTVTDTDADADAAADVSSYTTSQEIILTDPDGNAATETAAFDSDGSDGLVTYTVADGDIDEAGYWKIRVVLTSAAAVLSTVEETFLVVS